MITQYWSWNRFHHQWIGSQNKKLQIKSNASWFKQKNAPQARFFIKQNALQERFIKQIAPQARIFDEVQMGTLSYLYSM